MPDLRSDDLLFSGCLNSLLQLRQLRLNRFFDHKAAHFVLVEQHDGGAAADTLIRADYVTQGNTA